MHKSLHNNSGAPKLILSLMNDNSLDKFDCQQDKYTIAVFFLLGYALKIMQRSTIIFPISNALNFYHPSHTRLRTLNGKSCAGVTLDN